MTAPVGPVAAHAGRTAAPLEMWGGLECTINRVRKHYFYQLERNGHLKRPSDVELFAGLGVRAIRYPVLWEQLAPDGDLDAIDWSWPDERLGGLRALGVRPVVGLVHHGSGPRHTSLVDPGFATGLAAFAARVAERYPWVEEWTPVNEPLTTARFSGLYGLWYPHGRSTSAFARALVTQCRAVQLAMRAIRAVNPAARLVQTEDLGRIYSTPALAYEAELQNERRWLSFDLLCGRVDREHPFWERLVRWGIAEAELDEFLGAPCPPDLMGINYYLTSDRFLDDRIERYPGTRRGRVGRRKFVDVDAVRACPECPIGVGQRLREAWTRYQLPLAVTESHLAGTREEQMRWLVEGWRSANSVRREGVDVRAVTAWSLLGAFNWNVLVTRDAGFYEPGPFDVRGPAPRATALAGVVRTLARGAEPSHPVLEMPGWWRRPDRLFHPGAAQGRSYALPAVGGGESMRDRGARPLCVTGGTGALGLAVARLCDVRGIPYHVLSRDELDIADPAAVDAALARLQPWAVVNCAGWGRVDEAEEAPDACARANDDGAALLAAACARHGAQLVAFSSDLVFGGRDRTPRVESDPLDPQGAYGRSKARMERRVLDVLPSALVVRPGALFGPWDEGNFVTASLRALAAGEPLPPASDEVVSPTYVVDLVHATLDLLIDGERGVWHLANDGAVTWAELARRAAAAAKVDATGLLWPGPARLQGLAAPRPRYSALGSERGRLLPSLDYALARYVRHRALAVRALAPDGRERRRNFRPWRYEQAGGWI